MSNASDFFGGGIPNKGEFAIPISTSLNDLVDVFITPASLAADQVIVYNAVSGVWENKDFLYEYITNPPTIYSTLSTLTDVSFSGLASGDFLTYNGTDWVNTPIAGVISIDELSDVVITGPVNTGEVLQYQAGNWVNAQLDYADLTGTPYTPPNNTYAFSGLSDTSGAGTADYYLRWNGAGTDIIYEQYIPAANVSGLHAVATTGTLDSLTGVTVPTPSANDILQYVGGQWVNQPLSTITGSRINDGDNNTYVDVDDTTDNIILQAGPTGGNITLNPAGSGSVIIGGTGDATIESTNNIWITSTANDVMIQGLIYPSVDGTNGQVLVTDGAGTLSFQSISSGGATDLDGLSDVVITAPVNGQYLIRVGGVWQNTTVVTPTIPAELKDLSDVNPTLTPSLGKVLRYSASNEWDAYTLTLDDIDAVTIAGLSNHQVLFYNGSGWVNQQLTYANLGGSQPIPTMTLADLSGVDNALSEASGDVLYFNGTQWISQQLPATDVAGLQTVIDNRFNALINYPAVPANVSDLDDTDLLGLNVPATDEVLTWDVSGKWMSKPVPQVTLLSSLTGDVNINGMTLADNQFLRYDLGNTEWVNETFTVRLDNGVVEDALITAPTNNQYLRYNQGTSKWVNTTIDYSHITGTPPSTVTTFESLTNVYEGGGFVTGQLPRYDSAGLSGAGWYPYTPVPDSRIQDGNNETFVEVGTNDDIVMTCGDESLTGGNIIMNPNTTLNASAGVIINGSGATTYMTASNDLDISASGGNNVSIQGLVYPAVDGTAGQTIVTDGAGNLSFGTPTLDSVFMSNFKTGLTLSYTTTSTFTVAAGTCRDSTNVKTMVFGSPMVKDITSIWVAGSGNGSLPAAMVSNRFYYVFAICKANGTVDIGLDTVSNANNILTYVNGLPAQSGSPFLYYRLLGVVFNKAGSLVPFTQQGNTFAIMSPFTIYSSSSNLTIAETALTSNYIPSGVKLGVNVEFSFGSAATSTFRVFFGGTGFAPLTVTAADQSYGVMVPGGSAWLVSRSFEWFTPYVIKTSYTGADRTLYITANISSITI